MDFSLKYGHIKTQAPSEKKKKHIQTRTHALTEKYTCNERERDEINYLLICVYMEREKKKKQIHTNKERKE